MLCSKKAYFWLNSATSTLHQTDYRETGNGVADETKILLLLKLMTDPLRSRHESNMSAPILSGY